MPSQYFEARGARNASLHVAVSELEQELARLPAASTRAELRASWRKLVELLALDPLADLRACPTCKHVGMRAATRCSHCWSDLVPPAAGDPPDPSITLGSD